MKTRLLLTAMTLAAIPAFASAQEAPTPPAQKPPAEKPSGDKKDEVVVTGQSNTGVRTSIDRRSYSVSGDLQAQSGSIGDALRNVPSVEVDVQGNVSLRGDSNVTILIDGKPSALFQGDSQGQALQQLPANQIERVEVITNPSAEFRADGTAGVINLVTKKARGTGLTGSVRANVGPDGRANGGVNIGYNSGKATVAADVTFRHDLQDMTMEEDRGRLDSGTGLFDHTSQDLSQTVRFDLVNARVSGDYDITAKTRLGGELRVNAIDFGLKANSRFMREDSLGAPTSDFTRLLDIDQSRANTELSGRMRHVFGEGHTLTFDLSYEVTNDERTRRGRTVTAMPVLADVFDRQDIDNDVRQTEFKGDYVRPMGEGSTLKAGFDLQFDDNSYDNQGFRGASIAGLAPDATLTNLFLFEQSLLQGYVTYERPFGDFTALGGLRVEQVELDLNQVTQNRHDTNDYLRLYPSLHLGWKLSDSQTLTASYSHRVQRPGPEEYNSFRFLVDPVNYRAGNPLLKPQETHSYEAGYEYRKAATVYLATLYYRESHYGVADVVSDLGGGTYLTTRANLADSRSGGLELVANGRLWKTVNYNISGNLFWNELGAVGSGPTFAGTRSTVTAFARGSVTWQATPKDLLQLQAFGVGKRLTPQGYSEPAFGMNIGYRRKLTDKVSLVVTAQDVLGSFRDKQVIETPTLKSRLERKPNSQLVMVGFTWTFGGGRQRDPGFDFNSGGAPSQ